MPDERCLLDAGMPPDKARLVMERISEGNQEEATKILQAWRRELLNRLHGCEKQIDCLDYFLRQYTVTGSAPSGMKTEKE